MNQASWQVERSPRADLVLEGGGVKGIGLVGAVTALANAGYTFGRVAGTSAGAIVASAIACGVSPAAMQAALSAVSNQFLDPTPAARFPLLGPPVSLALRYGVYKGDFFREWLAKLLRDGHFGANAPRDVTFRDLRRAPDDGDDMTSPGVERAYKLVVMTADLTRGELVRLPWDYERLYGLNADDQLVADAVRASMSIPFFFLPVRMGASVLVDGGILSNFPIDVFDRRDGAPARWPTIGVKLTASPSANQIPIPAPGPLGFLERLVLAMMNGHDRMHLDDPGVVDRTIFVDTNDVSPINFALTATEKERLFATGERAANQFLARAVLPTRRPVPADARS